MAIITGDDLDNSLDGTSEADVISGLGGNDKLLGWNGDDQLFGGAGDDRLFGGNGDDLVHGGDGNDILDGSAGFELLYGDAGNDVLIAWAGPIEMHGGTGDDFYYVYRFGQTVVEGEGEGIDTVRSTRSYRLPDNVENLVIFEGRHGAGNALDNVINVISSAGGTALGTSLSGAAGDDTLHGGRGGDQLDGGLGADTMVGGAGNDTYVVGSTGDVVTELADEGTDTVRSAIDTRLGDNVENLVLIGSHALDGTGNDLANALTGNDAANVLDGGLGNDVLAGGLGRDVLTGGGGADSFVFDTAFGGSNIDRVTDFSPGEDRFLLDPAIFTQLPDGALSPDAFALGTAAADADDRILYDIDTGTLRYDRDGTGPGAARAFAIVVPGTALSASDFLIG